MGWGGGRRETGAGEARDGGGGGEKGVRCRCFSVFSLLSLRPTPLTQVITCVKGCGASLLFPTCSLFSLLSIHLLPSQRRCVRVCAFSSLPTSPPHSSALGSPASSTVTDSSSSSISATPSASGPTHPAPPVFFCLFSCPSAAGSARRAPALPPCSRTRGCAWQRGRGGWPAGAPCRAGCGRGARRAPRGGTVRLSHGSSSRARRWRTRSWGAALRVGLGGPCGSVGEWGGPWCGASLGGWVEKQKSMGERVSYTLLSSFFFSLLNTTQATENVSLNIQFKSKA